MDRVLAPDESYKRGLRHLPFEIQPGAVIKVQNLIPGLKDGPCELLFREQEMPPIDELDERTKYCLGVAMRIIGFALDEVEQSADQALRIYGALSEAALAHMERYRRGECGPFSVPELVDALLRITGSLFAEVDIRAITEEYVQRALTITPQPNNTPIPAGCVEVDPPIEEACNALLGRVPTFHIESSVYDQSEFAEWLAFRSDVHLPGDAFLIAVDGETWLPIKSGLYRGQTEWLLVDARANQWYLYEHVKFRGVGVKANAAQICGVMYNSETGEAHAIESSSIYVEDSGSVRPFTWPDKEADRLVHVALTFLMLLHNKRVTISPGRIIGHWSVSSPAGATVDQLVAEVLS